MAGVAEPALRPLPAKVCFLLDRAEAPPRLAAHLRAVHDVACQLLDALDAHYPALAYDREAVLFGAATHDIGKSVHTAELSGPGSAHEQAGYELLLSFGVELPLARFARTHAAWMAGDIEIDDLLVSLADKVWKGKRVPDLEQLVITRLTAASGQQTWEAFMCLDTILDTIAAGADQRLQFQARHPL